jgi:hypothetical protein
MLNADIKSEEPVSPKSIEELINPVLDWWACGAVREDKLIWGPKILRSVIASSSRDF